MDQAQPLRDRVRKRRGEQRVFPFTMTVTSGKGGVGKTNIVANLALSLAMLDRKVLVFDADIGLANLDVLLGLAPKYTIEHVVKGEMRLEEVLIEGPNGIMILPASSGVQELTSLDTSQKIALASQLEDYLSTVDVLLIDTSAGISENVMYFNSLAQEVLVVLSPEPTSLTDAYALMKVHSQRYARKQYKILCNSVSGEREAIDIYKRISMVTQRFLNVSLDLYGYIPLDEHVPLAVRQQRLLVDIYPKSEASLKFLSLGRKIDQKLYQYREDFLNRNVKRSFFSVMEMNQ